MKTFIGLILTFLISVLLLRLARKHYDFSLSGKIALAVMLLFTTLGHFIYTEGMTHMIPEVIPAKTFIIYFTAAIEVLAAIGLLIPKTSRLTGTMLIVFFILIHPANIYSAMHHVNMQTGGTDGPGLEYLWFRVPLQLIFIGWTYWFAVRIPKSKT